MNCCQNYRHIIARTANSRELKIPGVKIYCWNKSENCFSFEGLPHAWPICHICCLISGHTSSLLSHFCSPGFIHICFMSFLDAKCLAFENSLSLCIFFSFLCFLTLPWFCTPLVQKSWCLEKLSMHRIFQCQLVIDRSCTEPCCLPSSPSLTVFHFLFPSTI